MNASRMKGAWWIEIRDQEIKSAVYYTRSEHNLQNNSLKKITSEIFSVGCDLLKSFKIP